MGEDAFGGTDEVVAPVGMGSEGDNDKGFRRIDEGTAPATTCGHERRLLGRTDGQTAQGKQMQRCHERERIDLDARLLLDQRAVICWRRDRLRGDARNGNHQTDLLRHGV